MTQLAKWEVMNEDFLRNALAGAGARLEVSADRDSAGDGIRAQLLARLPAAHPWLAAANRKFEEDRISAMLADLVTSLR